MSIINDGFIGKVALQVFLGLFALTHALGVVIFALLLQWIIRDSGGLGVLFNWHPLLAVTGLVILQAQAILIYRGIRGVRKPVSKIVHAGIHFAAIACAGSAVIILIKARNLGFAFPKGLHGIMGVVSIFLFLAQYLAGLVIFLWPGAQPSTRAFAKPLHVYLGVSVFVLSCATALLMLKPIALNISLVLVAFCLLVTFLATYPNFRRKEHTSQESQESVDLPTQLGII